MLVSCKRPRRRGDAGRSRAGRSDAGACAVGRSRAVRPAGGRPGRSGQAGRRQGRARDCAVRTFRPRSNIAGPRATRRGAPCTNLAAPMPPTGKCRKRSPRGARRPTRARARRWSSSACSMRPARASPGTTRKRDAAAARRASRQSPRHLQSRRASRRRRCAGQIRHRPAQLLAKAAETNAEAQYQLGMMLAEGTGGEKDEVGARALFEKAAAQNHPAALEEMGEFAEDRARRSKGYRRRQVLLRARRGARR